MKRTRHTSSQDKLYIGIDNGVSGTIGAIYGDEVLLIQTPVFSEQNYTKKKGNITRVDYHKLLVWIRDLKNTYNPASTFCLIERPMVNPGRFAATISAIRALEATLLIIERLGLPYQYIDSREWQKALLPVGSKKEQLKSDSMDMGIRLFPQFKEQIRKHKDADGLLMAEYCRRYF